MMPPTEKAANPLPPNSGQAAYAQKRTSRLGCPIVYDRRMESARRSILRSSLLAAGLATIPYLAINLGQIAIHDGSFIHFSKQEALTFTVVLAFALWVGVAMILTICAWSLRGRRLPYCLAATTVFAILATAVEPRFWSWFFDLLNDGLAEWIFRTGVLATLLSLAFWKRGEGLNRVR